MLVPGAEQMPETNKFIQIELEQIVIMFIILKFIILN